MKQVVIYKNSLIKELSGSQIEFYPNVPESESIPMESGKVNLIKIPFSVKVLAGGKLDLDFKLSKILAENGVQLLGAYWDGKEVKAYFMPLEGMDVSISGDTPILIGTLVQVMSYRQVEAEILGGVVDLNQSGSAVVLETKEEEPRNEQAKKSKKRKKKNE
jgi:hypothetical protein